MPRPKPKIELPKYPSGSGPATAMAAPRYRETYRRYAEQLRRELEACESAFEESLARVDAARATRSRIDGLATAHRRSTGRN